MTVYHFGSAVDNSAFLEQVPSGPPPAGAVAAPQRPAAGLVLKVRDHATGVDLPDVVVEAYGYWSTTTADIPVIRVSADNWDTYMTFRAAEAMDAAASAPSDAAAALTIAQTASDKADLAVSKIIVGAPSSWPLVFPPSIGTTASTAAAGNHNHDTRYYTQAQVDAKVASSGAGGGGTLETAVSLTRFETTPGVYPARGTARTDLRITWVGTVQPPIAASGSATDFVTSGTAMDNVDSFELVS